MISDRVRKMMEDGLAYPLSKSPEDEEDYIKLCSNENPFGPPSQVIEAIKREAKNVDRYPEPTSVELKEAIGEYIDVNPIRICVGNGSDEVLDLICKATMNPGDETLIPIPTFSQYELACRINALNPNFFELEGFRWNAEKLLKVIDNYRTVFVCRPNNPTGNSLDEEGLKNLLETGKMIVVDEAYGDFSEDTVVDWVEDYENLMVLRTFSKIFGLAGLRVGYGVGNEEIIRAVERVRSPFNVNRLAQKAAIAALDDENFIEESRKVILNERKYLQVELEKLGFEILPSDANFIMASPAPFGMSARDVSNYLFREGILIRNLSGFRGIDGEWVRISVGRPDQNRQLIKTLEELKEIENERTASNSK